MFKKFGFVTGALDSLVGIAAASPAFRFRALLAGNHGGVGSEP